MKKIGIIGGSGLEKLDIFKDSKDLNVSTPYGEPSSPIRSGELYGAQVFIISRHGRQHTIPPTQVNNRANIQALKDLGCECIIATTACGSLRQEIDRGHIVVPDQFIDFTRHRINTFYDEFKPGEFGHVQMADPFDEYLRNIIINCANNLNLQYHHRGTVITIEGPRFSTRAESHMFRAWGADIINMTSATEVALANEAGLPYAAIALSTDYDCWKEEEEPVTGEAVLAIFKENLSAVTSLLNESIKNVCVENVIAN